MGRQNYVVFDNVTKRFGDLPVVDPAFNFSIPQGRFVAFLGPSGCGKTTLMRMIGGLDHPTEGHIRIDGQIVDEPDQRRGMVFQSYSSFPWLTVRQNIAFGMKYRRDFSAKTRASRTDHYLRLVGLQDFADAFPNRISGGMRQRVAIARALASGSDVLLMDEPFGALDALLREQLQVQLREIQRQEHKTVIFVTHDVDEAVFLADSIIVFSGRPARILADIDVTAALGEHRDLETRENDVFLKLRAQALHLLRNGAGVYQ